MNLRLSRPAILFLAVAALTPGMRAAKPPPSDVQPPDRRRVTVERAEELARTREMVALPAELASPFKPTGFDRPDPSETTRPEQRPGPKDPAGGTPSEPSAPATDRDLLTAVAAKIPTTGTIILGGKPLLISGTNRIEVGSLFTVIYNGQEYELELVAIERTTFTVRYKGEEFTRPIKLGKSP